MNTMHCQFIKRDKKYCKLKSKYHLYETKYCLMHYKKINNIKKKNKYLTNTKINNLIKVLELLNDVDINKS